MKNKKTLEQKMEEIEKKMELLKAQKKAIQNKANAEERKARTKRLISIGAEVEYFAGCAITNLENFKEYLKKYGDVIAKTQK